MRRPAVLASVTVVLVVAGLLLGVERGNLHNGLLALSFTGVALVVLGRRPGQREARLFLAAGLAEAVLFAGRQVGARPGPLRDVPGVEWVAWTGSWSLPLVLVLVGTTIMCFPDGRFPSGRWRAASAVMVALAGALALVAALWPVDRDRTGLVLAHPLDLPGAAGAAASYEVAAPVAFTAFQVIWLACVVTRLRRADADERRQLLWVAGAVGVGVGALVVVLLVDGSPAAGLLAVPLLPVAAGAAIVESSYVALVRDVRSAAQRVVVAQDDARRRIERDLHDGAQHRLVVLGMELGGLVEEARRSGDPELLDRATAARDQLLAATAELRELARGLHPAVLTQDGLAAALGQLADRSPVPVRLSLDAAAAGPCSGETEATAYFVVTEALTNAARHSGAGEVVVSVRLLPGGRLRVEVVDDGGGGAVLAGGLRGLDDRVPSLGGRLEVHSPPGRGTRLVAELPCRP